MALVPLNHTRQIYVDDATGELRYVTIDGNDVVTNVSPVITSSIHANSPDIDSFGRLRVSNPQTYFDSKQIFDNAPLFWDDQEVSGSGTGSSHDVNEAMTRMSVSTATGKRVRQTFMRLNYQPGKSQSVLMTGVLQCSGGGTGIVRAWGLFDDNNGLFIQDNEGVISFVRRTKTSGSVVNNETVLPTTFKDGTAIDWTKTQILFIDFEWLGVGRIRVGLFKDGAPEVLLTDNESNTITLPYMSTPNLPVRCEIENTGGGAASEIAQICASVTSEGGAQDTGTLRNRSTAGVHVVMNTENTLYAIVGLRLKSTHLAASIKMVKASIALLSNSDDVEWVMLFNPTIAGPPTWLNETNSALQYFLGATANTVTGGTAIDNGYISTGAGQSESDKATAQLQNARLLGSLIDGTPQSIVLAARPINGAATNVFVEGGITWREAS